ncbi:DNA-binding SARP family transcriptional activator [Saccharopolyspora phatthalungensis]|uniref:DNA-binding SARP family transcriptional activator n=1 Tax=Saccharopolyspora phatthalungensis TaxID=664693 RepID=A0A840Q6U9_9PSEU|nr:AfsR/SARP family transcriptional regulator [Saccharopolyspora phatthalungensis]MBB5154379.1 DNA-binding SARP family transcriptional activator [Saccharopolyspora phatthalungensis]
MDRLIDVVWDGQPPPKAKAALQGHVAQLRKVLGDGVEIVTRSPGYQLLADRTLLDVTRFEDLVAEARNASDADAVELLRAALALRRGPPLADVPAERLRREASAWLAESVVTTVHELARRLHRLGHAAEGIGLLQEAVKMQPLREPLVELLVLSLHQADRQAEALEVYHDTRTRLADELGVDPGAGLQRAFHIVLNAADEPKPAAVPSQLPRENRGFVGRDAELAQLDKTRDGAIAILTGPAGAGKTALALRWANRVCADFRDGHLFLDLRGFDEAEPVEPGQALGGFLRALGVPDAQVPDDLNERAALYRSVLAGRKVLVVLDNARSATQVRPLLPGTSGCAVLVSSRSRLDDLAATEGAVRVPVSALSQDAAVTVLRLALGADRVSAEPEAAAELAELCDRLPLALRIAAARAASHPRSTVRSLVDTLSDEHHRLSRLSLPDSGTGIRTALTRSYERLDAASARLFRLLGEHPGTDIDCFAAAALAGATVRENQGRLESLVALHLLHETGASRYGRADLVRLYTAAVAPEEPAAERDAAINRLLDYYLHTADRALRFVTDSGWRPRMRVAHPPAEFPELATAQAALSWFRAEETNLHHALALASARGQQERTCRLALCLERFHHHVGDLAAQTEVARRGLAAARELGNARAQEIFSIRIGENPVQ